MSIDLIQRFLFETDELKSLEKMLTTFLEISRRNKIQYVSIETDAPSLWHADGRHDDDNEDHDFHRFTVVPINKEFAVISINRMLGGISFQQILARFPTEDEAVNDARSRFVEPKPLRKWITSVPNPYGTPGKKAVKVAFGKAVGKIMEIVKAADKKSYYDDFHYVIPNWFDGSHAAGYRIEMDQGGNIDISFSMIWYGK